MGAIGLLAGASNLASALWVRDELDAFELLVRQRARRARMPPECIEDVLPVQHELDAPRPRPPHVTIVYLRGGGGAGARASRS